MKHRKPKMYKNSYFQRVYEIVLTIPEGRVTSYGAIADYLSLGSARMVGWAMTQSNKSADDLIPAHRVVNSQGELSGRIHFPTPSYMQEALEHEGVVIKNHKVVNFKEVFWHPEALDNY